MKFPLLFVALSAAVVASARDDDAAWTEGAAPDFLRDVRPILTQKCFGCHGPDEASREAGLRLDLGPVRNPALVEDLGGYALLVPGDAGASELIARLYDEEDPMPPVHALEALTDEERQTLSHWVASGATWVEHWAFVAPTKPTPPTDEELGDPSWAKGAIDRFVLQRVEAADLSPTPEAERAAWLRRVSFDLTGLPPTPEELDAFLADEREDAYERQVDRLFASEHYGERQAQEWLDVARYADSSGNQFDTSRTAWPWRDWVIEAYNDNKPFDVFVVEQLAGDLLPDPTLDQLVATGFNRNHQTDSDSPSEPDEYRTEYVIDRVHTTATAFMGMTMACAQCHDHKFDPISHEDYFSFYGFFNNVAERDIDFGNPRPSMHVPSPDQAPLLADLNLRIDELEQWLERDDPLLDREQARWEGRMREELGPPSEWPVWSTLEPSGMMSQNGARLRWQDDGSILAAGPTPVRDTYDLVFQPGKRKVQALRLEVLPDPSQPQGGSGRSAEGTFKLTKLELRDGSLSDGRTPPQVYLSLAQTDVEQDVEDDTVEYENVVQPGDLDGAISYESDDEDEGGFGGFGDFGGGGWTLVGRAVGERHEALLIPIEPLEWNDSSILKVTMEQRSSGRAKSLIGRFRWSVTDDPRVRETMLPLAPKHWSTLGPFPAEDAAAGYARAFEVEEDLEEGLDRKKRYELPKEEPEAKPGEGGKPGAPGAGPKGPAAAKPEGPAKAGQPKADAKPEGAAKAEQPKPGAKPEGAAMPAAEAVEQPDASAKPEADAKPTPDAKPEDGAMPAAEAEPAAKPEPEAKPAAEAKPEADAAPEAPAAEEPAPEVAFFGGPPREREPATLAWDEQDTWKDGDRNTVEVGTGVVYLTREVEALRPGLAELRLDGPAGVKVWLNGELVFEDAPEPPAPRPEAGQGGGDFDFFSFRRGRADAPDRTVRLGFREGTNELVVKAVYQAAPQRQSRRGGGGSDRKPTGTVQFDLTPEGEHVLTHEVATALRATAPVTRRTADATTPEPGVKRPTAATAKPSAGSGESEDDTQPDADPDDALFAPGATPVPQVSLPPVDLGVRTIQPAPQRHDLDTDRRHREVLREHYRTRVSAIGRALATELRRLEGERRELLEDIPSTLVMAERLEPRENYVFLRGDWRQRGQDVSVDTPSALPPMDPALPKNRLGLARWLTDGDHPLLGRVTMNRMWQAFFGLGLVETPEDFGVRSPVPDQAALLDWLAVEFVESGWDWQHMQKLVVLSATYRQSASASPEAFTADPENRMLARGPRLRLSAEEVRDNALFVSGLLNDEVGGPSVRPHQAKGVWSEVFGGRDWRKDKGEDQYRRGLYTYWKRRAPYPSMVTFDAQKGETCTVRRPDTTTPLQALVLLNNPVYVEAARAFAQRTTAEVEDSEGADAARLTQAFRRCTSRPPTAEELAVLTDLLAAQRQHYAADAEAAAELLKVGDAPLPDGHTEADAPELAAWTAVMSALLNLDATIHKG